MRVVVLGAGPAGLTAARLLSDRGIACRVLEGHDRVGGLSKTIEHGGYRFDVGGHRFFTKSPWVESFWSETLGTDFRHVKRLSRIRFQDRFFHYPLRPANALMNLGLLCSSQVALSFLRARLSPLKNEDNFEAYIVNRFGRKLYEIFFKSYTEKVWGIPCSEIRAEWARQRIKGLSFLSVLSDSFRPGTSRVRSLVDSFNYPTLGPGMVWESVKRHLERSGQRISLGCPVVRLLHDGSAIRNAVVQAVTGPEILTGTHFLSSIPLNQLIGMLEPAAPQRVLRAAAQLRHRSFIAVNLIVKRARVFPDNWVYVHVPEARVARIQNYKNWSAAMVPDESTTALGMEYFCFEGDELWNRTSEDLVRLATADLELLKLGGRDEVIDAVVHREAHAYPVYDRRYHSAIAVIREFLSQFTNLLPMGRNGLHKYNNQDHSMICARMAVENLLGANEDLWAVNSDQDYHEIVAASSFGSGQIGPDLVASPG